MNNLYNAKILLVDDSKELCEMVKGILKREGFQNVVMAETCQLAKEIFLYQRIDFIILDVMLPDGDGFSLLSFFIDKSNGTVPVLFLSARDEDRDRLYGLGLGADDYMTKPFLPEELILRIRSILKRTYLVDGVTKTIESKFTLGKKRIDFDCATVEEDGIICELTAKEMQLLKKLYDNRGNIVTFDAICQSLWGDNYYGYENSLMVHIRRLREKVENDPSNPIWIVTVRGIGYKLKKAD